MTVGVAMGISTMAAAALGNTISDVSGVALGGFIESMATKLGLPPSRLSRWAREEEEMCRLDSRVGQMWGIRRSCRELAGR